MQLLQTKQAVHPLARSRQDRQPDLLTSPEATVSSSVAACRSTCSQSLTAASAALQPYLALCTLHDVLQASLPTRLSHHCLKCNPQPAAPCCSRLPGVMPTLRQLRGCSAVPPARCSAGRLATRPSSCRLQLVCFTQAAEA